MTDPITTDAVRDTLDDHVLNELTDWLGRTCMPRKQFYVEAHARCIQAANAIAALRDLKGGDTP